MKKSSHWRLERKERAKIIAQIGKGNIIKEVEVDRNHPNGPEIHKISDTGIITIFNKRTKKMITQLIARPGQIRRYFNENEIIPTELLDLAREHQKMAYNMTQKKMKIFFFFLKKHLTDFILLVIIKTDKRKEIETMKERIERLNKEYYRATAIKDWATAKKLLDEITKLENERIFNFYGNLKKGLDK